jgi:N-acetylglucosamine-6-sulfatase
VRRAAVACVASIAALAIPFVAGGTRSSPANPGRPNIVVVLTDDQRLDSLPHDPPVMPYLQRQLEASGGWTRYTNAFVNTPLCCPSRATMLTGLYSHRTGVEGNDEGADLDESSTIATWLHEAGYRTGLVGKYLNNYPFDRGAYVPPGWDRFFAKENQSDATVYRDYTVVDDGVIRTYGSGPRDYATDVLAREAVEFIRSTPQGQPFLLFFTPSAPHAPWTPADRDAGAYSGIDVHDAPSVGEADVSDKPAWVRALPPVTEDQREAFRRDRRRGYETLRAVDAAMRSIDDALRIRGAYGDTVVFYLTDNGYALGEHRWETKSCPYEPCVHIPFLVRAPGSPGGTDPRLVSNVDLAPTIAGLAGVRPALAPDGESLVPALRGSSPAPRSGVLLEFAGGGGVPAWSAIRTRSFLWVELDTGERELYDLTGVLGPADPDQLENRADAAAYAGVRRRLASRLQALLAG